MSYFRLHPSQWVSKNDSSTIFRVLELADGNYLVTFKLEDNTTVELFYDRSEMIESISEGYWIKTNEKGDL